MSFNSKYFDRKAGSLEEAILKTVRGEAFEPHMMYDPKTGKGYKADTMDDHLRMKKMGYGHDKPEMKETNKNDKSDDGEGMDAVQPKAVKKKFANRKDKDIDNDGDVDSSDEYLHKRRKAVSKSMSKEENELDEKKANFLRLTFNSPADVKKARKWMDQNLPSADQGFTGVDYRAKDI